MDEPLNNPLNNDLSLAGLDWSGVPDVRMPDALSAAVLDRTRAMVRGRARRRRWRLAAGWGLMYAAGVCTALVLRPREVVEPQTVQVAEAPRVEQPNGDNSQPTAPAPRPASPEIESGASGEARSAPPTNLAALSPEELRERAAGAPRAEQIRLLRLAGDRYLYGAADMRAALNCYQQVIELTPRDELALIDPGDGWLLAELKQSAAQQ